MAETRPEWTEQVGRSRQGAAAKRRYRRGRERPAKATASRGRFAGRPTGEALTWPLEIRSGQLWGCSGRRASSRKARKGELELVVASVEVDVGATDPIRN